jgi:tetratricopeptide (TPR) repeat protein
VVDAAVVDAAKAAGIMTVPVNIAAGNASTKTVAQTDWSDKQFSQPGMKFTPRTPEELAALEAKLVENPEDFSARRDLLMAYFVSNRQARIKHVLWVIEHHPEFSAGGFSPYLSFVPSMDGAAYEQGKELWLKYVQQNPKNVTFLGNAADYLLVFDRGTAEDLLKRAQIIEPENPAWPKRLGELYQLGATGQQGTQSKAKALAEFADSEVKTLAQLEKGQPPGTVPAFDKLDDLAKTALAAGAIEKARSYATELLTEAQTRQGDWNYGNAIQHGNIVLGRIALREGKMDEAKEYLRQAGKTPGSPQLKSFGPNMSLAKDLLDKGETNAVLEYFQQCEKFWTMPGSKDKLETWAVLVKAGKTPDFGANLVY